MIAKNKGDFLYQLHNELHRIGIDDDEDIFSDFEEHFKESQEAGLSEEETCEKLGDVKEIARNYLDIPSTRLNSIVADAVANQRVSLTKPGEKLPADLSLVKDEPAEQPAIREFTPEHIMEEPETPAPVSPRVELNKDSTPVREFTPEHIAYEPDPPAKPREVTPEHIAPEQPAPSGNPADTRYQYGSIPRQTDEMHENSSQSRTGDVPPQCVPPVGDNAKSGGFKFSDIKGRPANVNVGKLIGCLVMDVFLWSWLIPLVISAIFGGLGSAAISLLAGGFAQLGNEYYHIISRILLCTGMVSAAALLGCAVFALCKAVFHWIKHIVIEHVKAIYDL